MDKPLTAETIERYERRVEEIEAERKRASRIERFARRIEAIEAEIKPQLDELRALKAGLSRLEQGAEGDPAVESAGSNSSAHGRTATSARQTAPLRRRR